MTLDRSFFVVNRRNSVLGLLSILLALVCCSPSRAQMGSVGTVTVLVLDPSGATVDGAHLVLQDLATNEIRSVDTQSGGNATFASVPLGTYKLTITKSGFQSQILSSVVVQGGRVTDVKTQLRVGAATETVVVSAAETPLLVVATAGKPASATARAVAASQALGSTSGSDW